MWIHLYARLYVRVHAEGCERNWLVGVLDEYNQNRQKYISISR